MHTCITSLKLSNRADTFHRNSYSGIITSVFPSGWIFRADVIQSNRGAEGNEHFHWFCEIGGWISEKDTRKDLLRHHPHHSVPTSSHLHCLLLALMCLWLRQWCLCSWRLRHRKRWITVVTQLKTQCLAWHKSNSSGVHELAALPMIHLR